MIVDTLNIHAIPYTNKTEHNPIHRKAGRMHNINILGDSVIRVDLSSRQRKAVSLPQAYEYLMADKVDAFPALRPHQRHAWHAFLSQLGAMAMHKRGVSEPPADADAWRDLLRGMTAKWQDDEPWRLVVDDITAPAFMQPPASSPDKAKDYKPDATTPDKLDMLVTSKNHDLKMAIGADAGADDWIFALVSLQTMAGYDGAGNHGIARMNGGLGNRPGFSLAPSQRIGAHIKRDITALANGIIPKGAPSDAASTLLWTRAWDGAKAEALALERLNPLCIEICRRIRLRRSDEGEGLRAIRATSKGARIDAKAQKGVTGDPWTPVDSKNGKALTLGAGGFSYKRVVQYLKHGDWDLPELCKATDSEQNSSDTMRLVARAMVRGQGKTEGYYERVIPVRKKMQTAMMPRGAGDRDELGEIADTRIDEVGKVQRILSHAIQVFAAGGDADGLSAEHRRLAQPWLNRLDEIVDASFFDALQDELEADDAERQAIHNDWLMNGADGVIDHARHTLRDAQDALPCAAIRRYKAQVRSDGMFEGRIRGAAAGLPFLFAEERGDNDDDND